MLNSVNINAQNSYLSVKSQVAKPSTSDVSFEGLNKLMQKKLYHDPSVIYSFVDAYPREKAQVGNIPKEMILALRKSNYSPVAVGKAINEVRDSFAAASKVLKEVEFISNENIEKFDFKEVNKEIFDAMSNQLDINKLGEIKSKLQEAVFPDINIVKSIANKAAKPLESAMKSSGVMPYDGKIEVGFLGAGSYGNVYKLSFLDKENGKIFSDKVLKVYKDDETIKMIESKMQGGLVDYVNTMSEEEYIERMTKGLAKNSDEYKSASEMYRCAYQEITNMDKDEYIESMNEAFQPIRDMHGVARESNASLLIKKSAGGNLEKTNFITPYYFDLKNNFGLFEMADDSLPPVSKEVNLDDLGLIHTDTEVNESNIKSGRIIDYGGITEL